MSETTGAEAIRWNLSDLFSSIEDPAIQSTLDHTVKEVKVFSETYKGNLHALTPKELCEAYRQLESLFTPLYKVSQYSHLLFATDTSDDAIKALVSRVDDIQSEVGNYLVFFDLELGAMSQDDFQKFESHEDLADYAYCLEMTRKTASYNLSEKEEQVINLKDLSGVSAFRKLYEELTASFEFEFEIDGKVKTMNGSELRALRQHKDADVRQRAMQLFLNRYKDNGLTFTSIFNAVLKDYSTEKKMRGYASAISRRNTGNDLEDAAVDALHQVTTESYALVQRYYKLKSKILKMDTMTLADIYAPLPQSNKTYSWDEAKTLVLDGFKRFDQEFYEFALRMFDDNRVDAPVQSKKRGGAFCSSSTPDIDPYVLLNFLGRPRDVATIAHELGHAIHDMYCADQTLFNYHPILPLAETASVFSEMIITDLLLERETDALAKQALLTDKLEDMFATSHRQNMFSCFEMAVHKRIDEQVISTSEFCDIYHKELQKMFGDSVSITDEYHWEWSAIPHIFEWPFYVYAYNFGNLLVMALYQQYKTEGDSFIPKLKKMLSMGSCATPKDITAIVGVDITDPNFWRQSLTQIEGYIDALESLVESR